MIRILTSLVAVFTLGTIQAQSPQTKEVPKLVVGITVDQLRGDYLEYFKFAFGEKGFKRLLSKGLVYKNIKFNFTHLNEASALATIYTGSTPNRHAIVDSHKYSIAERKIESIFYDKDYLGNHTNDNYSPLALRGSTIVDELKLASRGLSDAFSFASQASSALIMAGHYANTAYWIDEHHGRWASSTFYKDFYWTVDKENRKPDSYRVAMWGAKWTPLEGKDEYATLPYASSKKAFEHHLGGNKDTYLLSKHTPFANENVRNTAIDLLTKANLGKRNIPDFISLHFYAGKYPHTEDGGLEMKDIYVRLDKDIESLLDTIDSHIGLDNVLIFLSSTGYFRSEASSDEKFQLKDQVFYINRCEALLNMYLMAIYGQNEKWVEKYFNNQIYLNRALIENKKIDLKEIQQKAAEFVSEFSGVSASYSRHQLLQENIPSDLEYLKNSLHHQTCGDVIIELETNYRLADEQNSDKKEQLIRNDIVSCPVIFFGQNIEAKQISRTIDATEIAPSLAYIMRIRAPSAAISQALIELQ